MTVGEVNSMLETAIDSAVTTLTAMAGTLTMKAIPLILVGMALSLTPFGLKWVFRHFKKSAA